MKIKRRKITYLKKMKICIKANNNNEHILYNECKTATKLETNKLLQDQCSSAYYSTVQ